MTNRGCIYMVIWTLLLATLVILSVLFLSSRLAEASRGPTGYVIRECCPSVNSRSGTSNRVLAALIQQRMQSVFETGTASINYVLQWPELPSVADQAIAYARQRLSVFMAEDRKRRDAIRFAIDWRHTRNALGMALLAGGLMISISFWPYRKRGS